MGLSMMEFISTRIIRISIKTTIHRKDYYQSNNVGKFIIVPRMVKRNWCLWMDNLNMQGMFHCREAQNLEM